MTFFVHKRKNESSEKLINRLKKISQRSTRELRFNQTHSKSATKTKIRQAALKRETYRAARAKRKFYS